MEEFVYRLCRFGLALVCLAALVGFLIIVALRH